MQRGKKKVAMNRTEEVLLSEGGGQPSDDVGTAPRGIYKVTEVHERKMENYYHYTE